MNSILDALNRLSIRSKFGLLIGLPLLIAAIVVASLWSRDPDWRVLFSNMSDKDGGEIVALLSQQEVPYKISEGGTTILVPSNQVHEVRLRLASQGLPHGAGVGFELMDNAKLGLTQFQEQVNYQRSLEGELARSIQSLSSVAAARVHLAIPKPSVFLREQSKPTASVLVQMHAGRVLEKGQIAGIIHLVSSSVPELQPAAVSIVDQAGTLLSGASSRDAGLNASQLEYLQSVENQYNRRITELLTPIVGPGNVRAQVFVEMDFSQAEQTEETYKPNGTPDRNAIRSQQSQESAQPSGAAAGGVPGSLSNTPPGTASAPISGPGATNPGAAGGNAPTAATPPMATQKATTTNYEIDKTIRYTRETPGKVKRVAAAVVVNNKQTVTNGKTASTPLTKQEMDQIQSLVREAVGASTERKDTVSVINTSFTQPETIEPVDVPIWDRPGLMSTLKQLAGGALAATVIFYLMMSVVRPATRELFAYKPPVPPPQLGGPDDERSPGARPVNPQAQALAQAQKMAQDDPKLVASVVKNWVAGTE